MLKKILIFCAVSSAMLSGCSTLSTAQVAKGSGMSRVYNKDYITVWSATDEIVKNSGLSVVSSSKDMGEILAEGGMTAFSWGENVAVFVTELNNHQLKLVG
jgi:uncharacterized protein YceK